MTRSLTLVTALLLPAAAWGRQEEAPTTEEETPPPAETGPAEAAPTTQPAAAAVVNTGKIEAGLGIMFAPGPDENLSFGLGNWIGAALWGFYGINEEFKVGAELDFALVKPEFMTGQPNPKTFGGFQAKAEYMFTDMLGAAADLGLMTRDAFKLSMFDTPYYFDDLKFGFSIGPRLVYQADALTLNLGVNFVMQLDSEVGDDGQDEPFTGINIPLSLWYTVMPKLMVGGHTGFWTGHEFKIGASDGGRLPLFAGAIYDLGSVNVGLGLGFASLLTSDTLGSFYPSVAESFGLGAMVSWSNR